MLSRCCGEDTGPGLGFAVQSWSRGALRTTYTASMGNLSDHWESKPLPLGALGGEGTTRCVWTHTFWALKEHTNGSLGFGITIGLITLCVCRYHGACVEVKG